MENCVTFSTIVANSFRTTIADTGDGTKLDSPKGGAMRESLESEIPDTAPYKEWLAVVGSIAVAVVIFVVLFSNGVVVT